ncbi:MAG: hypothetical protein WCH39_14150 [Schlesneria sp.]
MSGRCSCPDCGTILRIRDRSFVGRRVNCPECKTALRISNQNEHGDFVARKLTPDELATPDHARRGKSAPPDKILVPAPTAHSFIGKLIDSPLTVAWLLAIGISAFVAVLVLAPKHRFAARPVPTINGNDAAVEPTQDHAPEQLQAVEPVADPSIVVQTSGTKAESDQVTTSVSALEPANIDGPLASLPLTIFTDTKQEQRAVILPPRPPQNNIKESLVFEFAEYKQTKPVSRRELIVTLCEHLGAPIEYDKEELGADELDKKITFEFDKRISLRDVIKAVTEPAGWQIEIEPNVLRIRRK